MGYFSILVLFTLLSAMIKENLSRTTIAPHRAKRNETDEAVLRRQVNDRLLRLENGEDIIKRKMSNLASLISNLERETSEMQRNLVNHTSEIGAIRTQLFDNQNSCSDPPTIGNGHPLMENGRKHGAVATYVCDGGRTLVGSADLVCNFGQWTGVLPRCANNCNSQDLEKEYDGLDIRRNTKVEHSKTLDIRCRRGYVISSASPTCNDGSWHVTNVPCIRASCTDDPPSLRNGKATGFERWHGSTVRYECERNFVMTGNSTVRCDSGKWDGHPPTCSYFDKSFYAQFYYQGSDVWKIRCYSDTNAEKIKISRLLDNGLIGALPPKTTPHTLRTEAGIDIASDFYDAVGVYDCGFKVEEGAMDIFIPFQFRHGLHFQESFKSANSEDTIRLQLHSSSNHPIRWQHQGHRIPSWDNKTEVEIRQAETTDAGVYRAEYEGDMRLAALLRLIVRKCKANLYGARCDNKCPPCYNGGVCHDVLGICICPEGFIGANCEKPCPEGHYGADCSARCTNDCKFKYFCKPDPYGCSCMRGVKGLQCAENCEPGWYGADCKQRCHCAKSPESCNRITGSCTGGCAPGWKGESCQIRGDD